MIYLTHPKHGMKPCSSEAEAQADIGNGWKCVPDKKPSDEDRKNDEDGAVSGKLTMATIKQRGKI